MLRVLHFSTHNEQCGVGRYQEMFLESMATDDAIVNDFFPVSPNQMKLMGSEEINAVMSQLKEMVTGYDILHVQHEVSFFRSEEMARIISVAKSVGKKVVVTVHASPNVVDAKVSFVGFGPRSWMHTLKQIRRRRWLFLSMISPIKMADMVIVHNEITKQALIDHGVSTDVIAKLTIPVPTIDHKMKSSEITDALHIGKGDIVLSTVGFLHRYKGLKEAVKCLSYLPEKYKLAVVGGLHPFTDDTKIYDELADLIRDLGLMHRVYITGYILDDERLNALMRETDIALYPYDGQYYSNVSSAALNNSFANYVPPIAYPTESFKEINAEGNYIELTSAFSYYELARSVKNLDIERAKKKSIEFSDKYSYREVSKKLKMLYETVLRS